MRNDRFDEQTVDGRTRRSYLSSDSAHMNSEELRVDWNLRREALERFVTALFEPLEATVEAVAHDGWSDAMIRRGLQMHRETWDLDVIFSAFLRELETVGGLKTLEEGTLRVPPTALHIWPTLPGAGVTPTLYGYLLGVPKQAIRPSRRAPHFAKHFVETWKNTVPEDVGALELIDAEDPWDVADLVVVSGTDETVDEIRRRVGASGRVIGHGHRVSFAVVVDDGDATRWCPALAEDIVMWHQQGCFSPRAVLFAGEEAAAKSFGAALGDEIAGAEQRLDARDIEPGEAALRAQRRGISEFQREIFGEGIGWVEWAEAPFTGERIAPHSVTLHRLEDVGQLHSTLDLPAGHIQGVALAAPEDRRNTWTRALIQEGATRVCRPGRLQSPPGDWPHDGRPNVLSWMGLTALR